MDLRIVILLWFSLVHVLTLWEHSFLFIIIIDREKRKKKILINTHMHTHKPRHRKKRVLTHSSTSNPCCCTPRAATCTNIPLSAAQWGKKDRGYFGWAPEPTNNSNLHLPFMVTLQPLRKRNHLIWLITERVHDLTSKPHGHHCPFECFLCGSECSWEGLHKSA